MTQSLVLLGASKNIVSAAKSLGHPLILVGPDPAIALQLDNWQEEFFQVDYTDLGAFREFCLAVLAHREIATVASVAESGQLPAAMARDLLGLPGVPLKVVKRTLDKLEMRRWLAERVPEITVPAASVDDPAACKSLMDTYGTLVGKPTSGTGSEGFRLLSDESSLVQYITDVSQAGGEHLVEPFIEGKEFTVETFSAGGRREHVAIVEKWVSDDRVELAHMLSPSPSQDVRERVERAVSLALDALEIDSCATCTEVFVTAESVTIIETHTRPGGDGLADLIQIVSGVDWRASAVAACIGGTDLIGGEPSAAAAGIVFWTASPGTVIRVLDDPPSALAVDVHLWIVDAKIGDTVAALRSSEDRLGVALISATSTDSCRSAIEMLLRARVVETSETA